MTEDQIRELLREMRDEPAPADSLARVRMRVDERTVPKAVRWWTSALATALLATALAVAVFWPRPQPPAPPVIATEADPAERPQLAAPPAKQAAAKPVRFGKRRPQPESGPVIRIETPDPNVVLMFVTRGDSGGED